MAERLWEVAYLHTAQGDLFGVQADVVCVGQHFSNARRVLQSARPGKRVDVEERAEREGALGALQAVGGRGGSYR